MRESLGCCKPNIMANASVNFEEQNAYRNGDNKDDVHEISGRNEKYLGDWVKDPGYNMLKKNLNTFNLYPGTLRKVRFINDRLLYEVEEIIW